LGTSPGWRGNRASSSKNFNNTLNPKRVAPDLLPTRRQSSSTSVHDAIRSSGSHSRRTSITSVSSTTSDDARHTNEQTGPSPLWGWGQLPKRWASLGDTKRICDRHLTPAAHVGADGRAQHTISASSFAARPAANGSTADGRSGALIVIALTSTTKGITRADAT